MLWLLVLFLPTRNGIFCQYFLLQDISDIYDCYIPVPGNDSFQMKLCFKWKRFRDVTVMSFLYEDHKTSKIV